MPKDGGTEAPVQPRSTHYNVSYSEFKWSPMHQRLLTDLLFALETDVHVLHVSFCTDYFQWERKNYFRLVESPGLLSKLYH